MRLIRLPEVLARTGLCRQTIWRMECDGQFPPRRRIGARAVAWVEAEVDAWVDSLPAVPSRQSAPAQDNEARL